MKTVAVERDAIRARERDRLARQKEKISLRQEPKAFMRNIVEQFKLGDWLGTENAKRQLASAGFRGQQAEIGFLFFRLVTPIGLFLFALFYLTVINNFGKGFIVQAGIVIGSAYIGIKAPEIYLSNAMSKRQLSMRRAFPDALDLMLICVESGISPSARSRPRSAASRCRSQRSSHFARPSFPTFPSVARPMRTWQPGPGWNR
jgi:tight adherence protein C